jgi:hypothetical protein
MGCGGCYMRQCATSSAARSRKPGSGRECTVRLRRHSGAAFASPMVCRKTLPFACLKSRIGKAAENDYLHKAMADKVPTPLDGRVEQAMDIACSIGKLTCALKQRFPEAEVWGSDISAPMVRYAHYRAVEQQRAVNCLQKAGEALDCHGPPYWPTAPEALLPAGYWVGSEP